jgi:hypothetical protein
VERFLRDMDDPELALTALVEAARGIARVLRDPAPVSRLMHFSDSGIDLELRFWIADPQSGVNNVRSEVNRAIWRAFKQHGITIPVAHHDGNYQADTATLDRLEGDGRVAFRYQEEVNGSARGIAGILNDAGNVLGMMPHPERALEDAHGNTDGRRLFEGLLETVAA